MTTRTWTDEAMMEAVQTSETYSEICRKLGLQVRGGNFHTIRKAAMRLGFSLDHLLGQSYQKGRKGFSKQPLAKILVENSTFSTGHLKNRLVKEEILAYHCVLCGLSEWQGSPLVLRLDHINGNPVDHRLENLRLLCPNCDSQQPTFSRGHRKRKKKEKKVCSRCGGKVSLNSKSGLCCRCSEAVGPLKKFKDSLRKAERPSKKELQKKVGEFGFCAVGREYGVSGNAIRKWLR